MQTILDYLYIFWAIVKNAMTLNPAAAQQASTYPNAFWYILLVAIVAGVSLLIGQSVILFVNQVKPVRFILSLFMNGLTFSISLIVWAFTIFVAGNLLFEARPMFSGVLNIVMLSAAPFVFGFLILIPYAGQFVYRLLSVWSFVIAMGAVRFSYNVGWVDALLAVGLGWLLSYVLTITIGKPIVAIRNRIAVRLLGTPMDATTKDILEAVMSDTDSRKAATSKTTEK